MTRLRDKMALKNLPLELVISEEAPVDDDLIESISENEQFDPIKVTPTEDGKYRIIGGKRRYWTAVELEKKTILAFVIQDVDDEEFVVRTLVDNSGRPNPMDEAKQMQKLKDQGWDNRRIAHVCRYEVHRIDRTLKLLDLISELQELVSRGEKKRKDGLKPGISFSTGYQLAKLPDSIQEEVFQEWESGKRITEISAYNKVREWQGSQVQSIFEEEIENETVPGLFIEGELAQKLSRGESIQVTYEGVLLILNAKTESDQMLEEIINQREEQNA